MQRMKELKVRVVRMDYGIYEVNVESKTDNEWRSTYIIGVDEDEGIPATAETIAGIVLRRVALSFNEKVVEEWVRDSWRD